MDLQAQIAARRAELKQKADEAQRAASEVARAQAKARQDADQMRRAKAMDEIAADLSRSGTSVQRNGDELEIANALPLLDIEGLRRSKVKSLLQREARKRWSPGQNWQVIALIVAGFFLVTFYGLGLLLIAAGMLRRSALNKRYQAEVRSQYPGLFPHLDAGR